MHPVKLSLLTPRQTTKNSSLKSHFRIKSQATIDTTPHKPLLHLPSIMRPSSQLREQRHIGLPLMTDDYHLRKCEYVETFVMGKKKVVRCEVAFTAKFCYITLHDSRADLYYKLRLMADTGRTLLDRFKGYKLLFKDYVERDQMKRYCLAAPFPPFERKYYFTPIEPSKVVEQECEQDDKFLKNAIKNLDRTHLIFGPSQQK